MKELRVDLYSDEYLETFMKRNLKKEDGVIKYMYEAISVS